jgi:2',3'-cyclic-nucleotide 2'-phosphodiesterase (5'-nucleotidase family)
VLSAYKREGARIKKLSSIFHIILLLLLFCSSAQAESVRILYLNDFHGFAEPYKPFGSDEMLGGLASLSARANELRNEKPTLLLAAGDMIQGNNWANFFQGASVIEAMNEMKFDAMATGNHEFDFGQDVLKQRILEAGFPVLCANVEGFSQLKPYIIKEIAGIRFGVIGLATADTPFTTHPKNVAGLKFISPEDALRHYLREVKAQSDIVVVLSHIGHQADRMLAEEVEGIDLIVGGHSHTKVLSPVIVKNTIILQAWEHAKTLGVLDLTVEEGKIVKYDGRLEEIKPASGTVDKEIMTVVTKYRENVDAVLNETIGETESDLDGEHVRERETNLGNLIADIMRAAAGSDATIINGGGIRTGMKKGLISVKNVYNVLPFNNYIVAIRLTGKEIKETLEHGVSAIEKNEGRFPQVSGLTFTYNASVSVGSRVSDILIAGSPIDPGREYTVATNDFLAAGGDGYTAFGDAVKSSKDFSVDGGVMKGEKLFYNDSSRWLRDVVIEHIKEREKIAPVPEGRIVGIQ